MRYLFAPNLGSSFFMNSLNIHILQKYQEKISYLLLLLTLTSNHTRGRSQALVSMGFGRKMQGKIRLRNVRSCLTMRSVVLACKSNYEKDHLRINDDGGVGGLDDRLRQHGGPAIAVWHSIFEG